MLFINKKTKNLKPQQMAEEKSAPAPAPVYVSKVLKRTTKVPFHVIKASTFKARKFQVQVPKDKLMTLLEGLPEEYNVHVQDMRDVLADHNSYNMWCTVEFLNSNNKLKENWDYEASNAELLHYKYKDEGCHPQPLWPCA
jgi:hypothetical protein